MSQPSRTRKVLVVGCANWLAGAGVLRYFHRAGFIVHIFASPTDTLARSRYAHRKVIAPLPVDRFIAKLKEYAVQFSNHYTFIILSDEVIINNLLPYAEEDWAQPFFPVNRENTDLRIFASKIAGANSLDRWELPQPIWRILRQECDVEAVAEALGFPIFLKPEACFGGEGAGRVDSIEAMRRFWRQRPVAQDYIAQQFIAGPVGSAAALLYGGKPLAAFFSRKAVCFPDLIGPSCVREFVNLPAICEYFGKFGRVTDFTGLLGMDIIVCEATGTPYIIELNIRPTPQMAFAALAGVDLTACLKSIVEGGPLHLSIPTSLGPAGCRRVRMFPADMLRSINEDSYLRILRAPFCRDYWRTAPLDDPLVLLRNLRSFLRPLCERVIRDLRHPRTRE